MFKPETMSDFEFNAQDVQDQEDRDRRRILRTKERIERQRITSELENRCQNVAVVGAVFIGLKLAQMTEHDTVFTWFIGALGCLMWNTKAYISQVTIKYFNHTHHPDAHV